MSTYAFRIRFLLPEDRIINYDGKILEIPLSISDKKLLLKSFSTSKKISESNNLVIFGRGFSSHEEANDCGSRVKNSLLVCGANLQMGIDVGKDTSRGVLSNHFMDMVRKGGAKLLNDIHGLSVYKEEEDMPVFFGSVGGTFISGSSSSKFVEVLTKIYNENPELSDKQTLALELYGAAHFETSLRARFLTLVIAIESLCQYESRAENTLKFLKTLEDLTTKDSTLEKAEKESLLSALRNLKYQSIANSCGKLIKLHQREFSIGDAVEFFKQCYKIRSAILHTGQPSREIRLGTEVSKLDRFVSELLVADILQAGKQRKGGLCSPLF
ncbi:MAG TPA: hypothetical protein VI914_04050 [Thermodesulfobacteriota bacterium]|nr:hypothetical protein [Thermodesulfobacteriota bacterium]